MVVLIQRTMLLPTLLSVLMAAFPASAQYAGIPGDIPPIPGSYMLDVEVSQPYESADSIPGITDEEAYRIENHGEDEIIYRRDGIAIARIENSEDQCDFAYLFTGEWGLNYEEFFNAVCISQLSPSGRYYAVGCDGTGTSRGPVIRNRSGNRREILYYTFQCMGLLGLDRRGLSANRERR